MNLSISNIAWSQNYDSEMYSFLKDEGFTGIEIAPTRIFGKDPYEKISQAKEFINILKSKYNLKIVSMQSIWYGINYNLFAKNNEREFLINYTKKAIDFAKILGCKNIVFGCPKNRIIPSDKYLSMAYDFFSETGNYAKKHNTIFSLEPNPEIYGTNFINKTEEAFNLAKEIKSEGIMVNFDLGAFIYNKENLDILKENINLVNHAHISEPYLLEIERREIHKDFEKVLRLLSYDKFVSIEMKNLNDINRVKKVIKYIKEVFA